MWLCSQLGGREHYVVPRALFRQGVLGHVITDAWVSPTSLLARVSSRTSEVRSRFQSELRDTRVTAFNSSLILFEMLAKTKRLRGWPLIMARNQWFHRKVVDYLSSSRFSVLGSRPILFDYSYTALEIFRFSKARGWKTLLVPLDPGRAEVEIISA